MEKETISHFGIVEIMREMVLCVRGRIFRSVSRLAGEWGIGIVSFVCFLNFIRNGKP